jgi:hypothetical protein
MTMPFNSAPEILWSVVGLGRNVARADRFLRLARRILGS